METIDKSPVNIIIFLLSFQGSIQSFCNCGKKLISQSDYWLSKYCYNSTPSRTRTWSRESVDDLRLTEDLSLSFYIS